MSVDGKRYMNPPVIDVAGIKEQIKNESIEKKDKQRFGFFSITQSNNIGDEYYSQKRKIERDSNGKVIIKNSIRGIYAHNTKKGKFIDSYFDASFIKESPELRKRMEQIAELEHKERLEKVAKSRDKANRKVLEVFKPSGLQGYKDIFLPDVIEYKVPIYKPSEKRKNINFAEKKVYTEKRGIFTSPLKHGSWSSKGVLFEFERFTKEEIDKFREMTEKEKIDELKRKAKMYDDAKKKLNKKTAFVPANTAKCNVFFSDRDTYGLEDDIYKKLIKEFEEKEKLKKSVDHKYAKHIGPFKPASLTKLGNEGFFTKISYKVTQAPVLKKMTLEELKKKRLGKHDKEFGLNRVMQSSVFSPSVQLALPNLKKAFPSIFT